MHKSTALLMAGCVVLCAACSSQPEPSGSGENARTEPLISESESVFDSARSPVLLSDPTATAFAGSTTIPWRSQDYSIESVVDSDRLLAQPLFRRYTDDEAKPRLSNACSTFFGRAPTVPAVDQGESFSLEVPGGLAWIAKDSGALTLQRYSEEVSISVVKDAHQAVQLAARQLGELGLWNLDANVSLDIIGVSATMNATWVPEEDGSFSPLPVPVPVSGEYVTQFVSQHLVTFGRRYKGIPIEGGALKAVIDSTGALVGVLQEWRQISGESDTRIAIDEPATVDSRRNPIAKSFPLDSRVCSFFEAPFVGWVQDAAGVGCLFRTVTPDGYGLGRLQSDFVSMTSGPKSSVTGTPLSAGQ